MLADLRVRGLGVIDDLTLPLGPGMTALTGETGAGKTLVVEALQLVLGARADAGLVRHGAEGALVEATFDVHGTDGEGPGELILGRSVAAAGRSKAYVDGRTVPQAVLSDTAADLVDICGQHDHQSLLRAAAPARALDAFAGIDTGPLQRAVAQRDQLRRQLDALGGDPAQRARELDMLRFQVAEIDGAGIDDPDEESALWAEEQTLADASALREEGARALSLLDGPSGADALAEAARLLDGREPFAPWAGRLRAAVADVADLVSELRAAVESWQEDPDRLAAVQTRRRLLADLRRKYGATLADVAAFGEDARTRLDELSSADGSAAALTAELDRVAATLDAEAAALRAARHAASGDLARAVTTRLAALAMPGARLEVTVAEDGAGEPVRFLLAANAGEPAQPLQRVASGGELARTMLALRLETMGGAPVLVFDEVDAGVGGEAALALATALRDVARRHQVLVVTHLPQVAAFADHQVVVEKTVAGGRTTATARTLDDEARVVELSRMLSGHPDSETARAHAAELLAHGRSATRVHAVD